MNKYFITEEAEGGYWKAVMPENYSEYLSSFESYLASLPSVLVHPSFKVKAGDWISEWREGYEVLSPTELGSEWHEATKEHYDLCSNLERRRIALLPIEEKKEEVKPWPFNGYAPGHYINDCAVCKKTMEQEKVDTYSVNSLQPEKMISNIPVLIELAKLRRLKDGFNVAVLDYRKQTIS